MASEKTTELQLNIWKPTDNVSMSEFNENFQKIDSGIVATEQKIDNEIQQVTQQLAQKVDEVIQNGSIVTFRASGDNLATFDLSVAANATLVQSYVDSLVSSGVIEGATIADGVVNIEKLDPLVAQDIKSVSDINQYLTSGKPLKLSTEEVKIQNADWTLENVSLSNEAEGVLYLRTTTGNFGAIHTSNNKIKFTVKPNATNVPYLLVGISPTTYTIVGFRSGSERKVLEVTKASTTYTQLLARNTSIVGAVVGDMVTAELKGNELIVNILRVGSTDFVELFKLDLSTLTGATGWKTTPRLGFATDTTLNRVGSDVFAIIDPDVASLPLLEIGKDVSDAIIKINNRLVGAESQIEFLNPVTNQGRWVGKTVNILGDSFTQRNLYPPVVKEILGIATVNNYGSSGDTIAIHANDSSPMSVRYTTMANNADLNIVEGGVNDYGNGSFGSMGGIPIGTNTDTTNTTFKGALRVLIEGLLRKYPTQKIAFITPCQMNEANAALGYKNGKKANAAGHYLIEYVDAMLEICAEYGIPCLDMYRSLGLHELNMVSWTLDGLHLNELGSTYYGQKLAEWLKGI